MDGFGNAYVTGETNSTNFPLANPVQNFCACSGGIHDVFVTKLNSAGNALVYSTYLGGSGDDVGRAIAVDSSGSAYVTGNTSSGSGGGNPGFPTSTGAFERCPFGSCSGFILASFVTKFHTTGFIIYSTYLGLGAVATNSSGIAVDVSGNAYVTGYTNSLNFPTRNPLQPTKAGARDAFVTKFNNSGSDLVYSTYLGGFDDDEGTAIAVDSLGNAYITGYTNSFSFPTTPSSFQSNKPSGSTEAFVTKLSASGSALVYSTYLGGNRTDIGNGIAVDAHRRAYVTGSTISTNFPTASPLQSTFRGCPSLETNCEAFVTVLNAVGSALAFSTYLGGSNPDTGNGIAVDSFGNVYLTGETNSYGDQFLLPFPTTPGAFQTSLPGSPQISPDAAFVVKISRLPFGGVTGDFDRDGKTDVALYRNGVWLIVRSSDGGITVTNWGGLSGDVVVPADYDGDGKTDVAVYRGGTWFIVRSSDGGITVTNWGGLPQDVPVPADYDGDGKTDVAVYRGGIWFIVRSSDGGITVTNWGGLAQDIPLN